MSVYVRNVPKGHNWGWFSREDPRMHLQSVERKYDYKVWLEDRGKRVFEPVGKIPGPVLKKLAEYVSAHRTLIEDNWAAFMIAQHWIHMHIALPEITLVAYPNYPHKFTRKIDLGEYFIPSHLADLRPEIIELNEELASLRLFTNKTEDRVDDIRLSKILWQD